MSSWWISTTWYSLSFNSSRSESNYAFLGCNTNKKEGLNIKRKDGGLCMKSKAGCLNSQYVSVIKKSGCFSQFKISHSMIIHPSKSISSNNGFFFCCWSQSGESNLGFCASKAEALSTRPMASQWHMGPRYKWIWSKSANQCPVVPVLASKVLGEDTVPQCVFCIYRSLEQASFQYKVPNRTKIHRKMEHFDTFIKNFTKK